MNNNIIFKRYPGYLEGSFYEIHKCVNCDTHFIVPDKNFHKIYDIIYSSTQTHGYDRYYHYVKIVKDKDDPLKFLAENESTYYPVYNYVESKNGLTILEVGCGYGYLSYALHKRGFSVMGIDIAANAINIARKSFGDYFFNMDLKEFINNSSDKFDLIIATELIEHLENPNEFLGDCLKLLNEDGKILLTTPDKDYYEPDSVWQTDLPPVHNFWIGRKGINILAEKQNLIPHFFDFSKYYSKLENRLLTYILSRKEKIGKSSLSKDGIPLKAPELSFTEKIYLRLLNRPSAVRFLSNYIYNLFFGSEYTLGVIFERKSS